MICTAQLEEMHTVFGKTCLHPGESDEMNCSEDNNYKLTNHTSFTWEEPTRRGGRGHSYTVSHQFVSIQLYVDHDPINQNTNTSINLGPAASYIHVL